MLHVVTAAIPGGLLNPSSIQYPVSSIQHRAAHAWRRFGVSVRLIIASALIAALPVLGAAQEIEPRTYANTPVGMNFLAVGYSYSSGNTLSQNPFFVAKVNVIRSIRPGLWWAIGTGYGQGGQTFVNGEPRNTKQKNWRISVVVAYPLSPTQGTRADRRFRQDISGRPGIRCRSPRLPVRVVSVVKCPACFEIKRRVFDV